MGYGALVLGFWSVDEVVCIAVLVFPAEHAALVVDFWSVDEVVFECVPYNFDVDVLFSSCVCVCVCVCVSSRSCVACADRCMVGVDVGVLKLLRVHSGSYELAHVLCADEATFGAK